MSKVSEAVDNIGSQTVLGRILGVTQQSVWDWINKYQQAPAKYIRKISALTNNEVTIEQLLSDHENNHKKDITQ